MAEEAKLIGAGCATIAVAGAGIGIAFCSFVNWVARNPSLTKTLFWCTFSVVMLLVWEALLFKTVGCVGRPALPSVSLDAFLPVTTQVLKHSSQELIQFSELVTESNLTYDVRICDIWSQNSQIREHTRNVVASSMAWELDLHHGYGSSGSSLSDPCQFLPIGRFVQCFGPLIERFYTLNPVAHIRSTSDIGRAMVFFNLVNQNSMFTLDAWVHDYSCLPLRRIITAIILDNPSITHFCERNDYRANLFNDVLYRQHIYRPDQHPFSASSEAEGWYFLQQGMSTDNRGRWCWPSVVPLPWWIREQVNQGTVANVFDPYWWQH